MVFSSGEFMKCDWKDGKPDGEGFIQKGDFPVEKVRWVNGKLIENY